MVAPETLDWLAKARESLHYPKLSLMCPKCGARITVVQFDELRGGAFGEMAGFAFFPERRSDSRLGGVSYATDPEVSVAAAERWQRQKLSCPGRRKKACGYSATVRTEKMTDAYVRAARAGKKRFDLNA